MEPFVHPTSEVEPGASLASGVKVWHFCHVRKGAVLGEDVSLGKGCYVDSGVVVGRGSRIQNGVSLYKGVQVGEWCFIGPHAVFTNDLVPRVGMDSWKVVETILEPGMSIGAGSTIVCGSRIGAFAIVGAGSVVTQPVPPFHLVTGTPARVTKMVCACGSTYLPIGSPPKELVRECCETKLKAPILLVAKKTIDHWMEELKNFEKFIQSDGQQ
jgi:UDP-2-acetamido-3-amino-2,3-dideoxy-glucuronate N-acetyltransferase